MTAPVDGTYQVSAGATWQADNSGVRELNILVGITPVATDRVAAAGATETAQSVTTLVQLNAGQTVSFDASETAAGALELQGGANQTWLAMHWVGPLS